jgi:hypothetical protein
MIGIAVSSPKWVVIDWGRPVGGPAFKEDEIEAPAPRKWGWGEGRGWLHASDPMRQTETRRPERLADARAEAQDSFLAGRRSVSRRRLGGPYRCLSSWPSTRLASSIESILPIAFAGTPGGQSGQGVVRTHPRRLPDRSVGDPTSASCFRSTMPAGTNPRTWQCRTFQPAHSPVLHRTSLGVRRRTARQPLLRHHREPRSRGGERCLVAQPARPDEAFPAS